MGAACPFGRHSTKPCADDPVCVGVSQPAISQQRPRGQHHLVTDFHAVGGEGKEPCGGESLQDRCHIGGFG